jgi:hypothetical protein
MVGEPTTRIVIVISNAVRRRKNPHIAKCAMRAAPGSHGDTLRRWGFTIPACAVRNMVVSEKTQGRLTPDEIHRHSIRLEQHR